MEKRTARTYAERSNTLTAEASELPTRLYSRMKYQGRLWDYQVTEKDAEGEVIYWLYTDLNNGQDLIIFND